MGLWQSFVSGVSTVVDAVQSGVETVADAAENAVDGAENAAEEAVDAAVDWIVRNANVGGKDGGLISTGGVAILLGAFINGNLETAKNIVKGYIHQATGLSKAVTSLLKGDLKGALQGLIDFGIGVGEVVAAAIRWLTGGAFVGKIVNSVERNELWSFVENLLEAQFTGKRLQDVRTRLKMDEARWGLTCDAVHNVFTLDSATFPLASAHNNNTLDLFSMAGVPSPRPAPLFRTRCTVKTIADDGSESLFPATWDDVSNFLANGTPRIKVYAMNGTQLRDLMEFTDRHFRQACIRFKWNQTIVFPRQHTPVSFALTTEQQFSALVDHCDNKTLVSPLGELLDTTGLKPRNESNFTIRMQATFKLLNLDASNLNGLTVGRDIRETAFAACSNPNAASDRCVVAPVTIANKTTIGAGIFTRQVFPNYFSKIVTAHELGHYFGLCHFSHDGIQNIMFSNAAGNEIFNAGFLRFYLNSEPDFNLDDKKNMWTFIVNKLGGDL